MVYMCIRVERSWNMKITPLYDLKIYRIKIYPPKEEYPHGEHVFYNSFDLNKFLDLVDLSKYEFIAGVE